MVTPGAFHAALRSSASPAKSGGAAAGQLYQSRLARLDATQRRFPAPLELIGDEAIVGILGGITPLRERGFIVGPGQERWNDQANAFATARRRETRNMLRPVMTQVAPAPATDEHAVIAEKACLVNLADLGPPRRSIGRDPLGLAGAQD